MKIRTQLLENQLDALDRLFDGKMRVIDLHALTYATAQALPDDPIYPDLDHAARALAVIVRQGLIDSDQREAALIETDALRYKLADELPFPLPPMVRLYKAIIFANKENATGEHVSVYAKNLVTAKEVLEDKYGVGTVFDLHNEEDANAPR